MTDSKRHLTTSILAAEKLNVFPSIPSSLFSPCYVLKHQWFPHVPQLSWFYVFPVRCKNPRAWSWQKFGSGKGEDHLQTKTNRTIWGWVTSLGSFPATVKVISIGSSGHDLNFDIRNVHNCVAERDISLLGKGNSHQLLREKTFMDGWRNGWMDDNVHVIVWKLTNNCIRNGYNFTVSRLWPSFLHFWTLFGHRVESLGFIIEKNWRLPLLTIDNDCTMVVPWNISV